MQTLENKNPRTHWIRGLFWLYDLPRHFTMTFDALPSTTFT